MIRLRGGADAEAADLLDALAQLADRDDPRVVARGDRRAAKRLEDPCGVTPVEPAAGRPDRRGNSERAQVRQPADVVEVEVGQDDL